MIEKLQQEIRKNIIQTPEGPFVQAGCHQFQSFWTRDFCFASWGLIKMGEFTVVKNHLQYLLDHLRHDGLVARIIESQWSGKTVILNTVFRFLPYSLRKNTHQKKMKPEYLGEHGTLSIDSNALVIISSFFYAQVSGDQQFLLKNKNKLLQAFEFYRQRLSADLIEQAEYEDWQDSVKRRGKTFYTNLLYWKAAQLLVQQSLLDFDLERLRQSIHQTFWCGKFYQSLERGRQNSLEGNYLALLWNFCQIEHRQLIFDSCQEYVVNHLPLCTQPNYASSEVSWTTKLVGLSRYHDQMCWSWILGLKIAAEKSFSSQQSLTVLEELFKRDDTIYEIYDTKLQPFETLSYKSESPFSWGIGIILWALKS